MAVAPFTGAWIETIVAAPERENPQSRPSRARGLKQGRKKGSAIAGGSRPSRARGLKRLGLDARRWDRRVAPFTGAWIETATRTRTRTRTRIPVAPFTGAWIETQNRRPHERLDDVAPFTGAWIET